jgi:hypothetical protein
MTIIFMPQEPAGVKIMKWNDVVLQDGEIFVIIHIRA